jgi:NADPH-dependent 2,4-dienoyl-CoA reductase/sulfur reductase-like enzyme
MKKSDIVIIGGSAAGLTAAVTARRHYPEKSILLVRREPQVPIPCGIPYVFGTVGDPQKNLMPDALLEKNQIELLVAEATRLDVAAKTVETTAGPVAYDRLVLATGSSPSSPRIPGAELDGVFSVRKDIAYLRQMQARLASARHVVIIGGGFIGIELADEINKTGGKQVTIVEVAEHCLNLAYDEEFCVRMEAHVRARGVAIRTGTKVERLEGNGRVERAVLAGGEILPADFVILAVGSAANAELARAAGIEVGRHTGAIKVDQAMRTFAPDVFACGDCAKKISFFGGIPSYLRLASIATSEARIAGANLYGIRRENIGTVGVWSTAVGDLAMGTAGLTDTMAQAQGYQTVSTTVEGPNRHPGGMPGAVPTMVKLVFERHSGVIIGGQVAGDASAGEIINALSACIQSRMTADEMATFQMGTHPMLTASPVAYPVVNAAEMAVSKMRAG